MKKNGRKQSILNKIRSVTAPVKRKTMKLRTASQFNDDKNILQTENLCYNDMKYMNLAIWGIYKEIISKEDIPEIEKHRIIEVRYGAIYN